MENSFKNIYGLLTHIPILGALTQSELDELLPLFILKKYKSGETIISEGGSPTNLYLIKKGDVSVKKNGFELLRLGFGDSFGEVEIIGILPYLASCIAITDCEIWVLPKKVLYSMKVNNTELFIKFILNISRECCRRLAKADKFIMSTFEYNLEENGDYY